RRRLRGSAEHRDVIQLLAEERAAARSTIESQHLIALQDLLDLLEAPATEHRRQQLHRRRALTRTHLLETHATARHHGDRQIRPPRALLLIVERVDHGASLALIECREESV